jgi:peptide/nickel transport system substrate-binding protein
LLKSSGNGNYENDLAKSYEITDNGTVYHFVLKDNAYFHDNKKVTADDVIFTIGKILDPVIKSPKRANWEGVLVEKISDTELKFTLNKPYAPFLEALTVGIIPKHIWENVSSEEFPFSEFNINPVGSGPYKIDKIIRNSGGIPTTINLSSWKKYPPERPKIESITLKFFQNENELYKAYLDQSVDSIAGLSPTIGKQLIGKGALVEDISLPRVFGVFFNQNVAPVFLNQEVRVALNMATPKKQIVDDVLFGLGRIINGPTPVNKETDLTKIVGDVEGAKTLLSNAGWKENSDGILEKKIKNDKVVLAFSITTSDTPELKRTAEILQEAWGKLGAKVDVKIFEPGDLSQNIIRGRKYDALLFGEVVGEESDLYPFWHSSQRNDPGLNISLYANITVDKMLEEIEASTNNKEKMEKKAAVFSEIAKDTPAIFLFSPNLLYAKAPSVKNMLIKDVSSQSERFLHIDKWYIETDKVWKFLAKI